MKDIAHTLARQLSALVCVCVFGLFSSGTAQAAAIVNPTQGDTPTKIGELIESKALVFSNTEDSIGTVVFSITFSLSAFGRDMEMPLATVREKGSSIPGDTIGYSIKDRDGNLIKSGYEAAILLPHTPRTSDMHTTLELGEKQTFTLLVAYSDAPVVDREDRMIISTLPLLASDGMLVDLNRSELQHLKTNLISL